MDDAVTSTTTVRRGFNPLGKVHGAAQARSGREAAGCYWIFADVTSGALDARPELAAAMDYQRPGDTLVVWSLDRLGRSLRHLIDTVTALDARGVGFRSATEAIDTTAGGRLVFHVFGALAEFEVMRTVELFAA